MRRGGREVVPNPAGLAIGVYVYQYMKVEAHMFKNLSHGYFEVLPPPVMKRLRSARRLAMPRRQPPLRNIRPLIMALVKPKRPMNALRRGSDLSTPRCCRRIGYARGQMKKYTRRHLR